MVPGAGGPPEAPGAWPPGPWRPSSPQQVVVPAAVSRAGGIPAKASARTPGQGGREPEESPCRCRRRVPIGVRPGRCAGTESAIGQIRSTSVRVIAPEASGARIAPVAQRLRTDTSRSARAVLEGMSGRRQFCLRGATRCCPLVKVHGIVPPARRPQARTGILWGSRLRSTIHLALVAAEDRLQVVGHAGGMFSSRFSGRVPPRRAHGQVWPPLGGLGNPREAQGSWLDQGRC